jgi:hypothetical protein
MRKLILSIFAVAGVIAFATAAQAACDGMRMADGDENIVVTDTTTPIVPTQSGG